jgi:uncharacterized membrane protein YhaH (DUF805 family)
MTENPSSAAPFPLILQYRGKATRGQFWLGMLMLAGALLFAMILFAPYFSTTGSNDPFSKVLVFVFLGVGLWLHSAFCIARLRDRGRPIWWYLIYGFGPFVLYYVARKTEGNISNQPGAVSVAADFSTLALILLALADLGFGKSASGTPIQIVQ